MIALAAIAALPVAAAGAHGVDAQTGMSGSELHAYETETLGAEHAAEHTEQRRDERRAMRRWEALSPQQQRRERRRERQASLELARESAARAPAGRIGRWTHAPFALPNSFAIHSVMLPTGKVLYWGFPAEPPNVGNGTLWDPSKGYGPGAFTNVPPPVVDPDGAGPQPPVVAPIYCSGQSFLPDGEVLVTGGNLVFPNGRTDPAYADWAGLNRAFTFNPWTERWTEQPQMNDGRWYPSQVMLADGRTISIGGYGDEAPGKILNMDFEVFTPGSGPGSVGSFSLHPEVDLPVGLLYPHLFMLPDERVAVAGPLPKHAALIDARDPDDPITWTELPRSIEQRNGGNAVLEPGSPRGSWKVTMLGGIGGQPNPDGRLPSATTETINLKKPDEGWKPGSPLNISRDYQNTVLLPDRSMVTIGGGYGENEEDGVYRIDSDGARRQVEVYDPDTKKWRLGPAQMEDRGYHATALLLPDGRVFSGGDNKHPLEPDGENSLTDTAEIYSPPYLFKGKRPVIKKAPKKADWNQRIKVATKGRSKATSAVLVAPAATTHGNDMNQRLIPLKVKKPKKQKGKNRKRGRHDKRGKNSKRGFKGLRVITPPSAGVAPPGYYMLFVLNKKDVPSVAKWVQLGG